MRQLGRQTARLVLALAVLLTCAAGLHGGDAAAARKAQGQLIIVNKQSNELAFFEDGEVIRTFSVATGKTEELTPDGTFTIVNKIKNRPYYTDNIPGGDPKNPLGDRWLGLDVNGTPGNTYAIHGNNNESSIGKYVSAGCIRMHNEEVRWLYDRIQVDTPVIVTTTSLSMEGIAEKYGYEVGVSEFTGTLLVNGREPKLNNSILLVNDRIFIPMRECFTLLGATIRWSQADRTVTAIAGDRTIVHRPGSDTAKVNGEKVAMTPSRYEGYSVMVPLRDVARLTGYGVRWDNATKTVTLTSPRAK
ncbi:L,D-transpeptidase family protein [Paenibacillus sp. IB182496]|uniref:L,D-transpeptidase family protein n=1 Tax=Paenibacillus sabuli TaxID=2772509 RepID=A0A927BY82_9BACL|nr:L,D-transpeptidase family protein [Paenibacillus sabuli]MBD2848557.1 L,D-transpeptidase family protein [Paenibacillus sabuli]